MANIKCIITYPDNFISQIGEFEINVKEAKEDIQSPGVLHVTRKKVDTSLFVSVVGMLFGPKNLVCEMDVFSGEEKLNKEKIKGIYKPKAGGYLFNWFLK